LHEKNGKSLFSHEKGGKKKKGKGKEREWWWWKLLPVYNEEL